MKNAEVIETKKLKDIPDRTFFQSDGIQCYRLFENSDGTVKCRIVHYSDFNKIRHLNNTGEFNLNPSRAVILAGP